MSILELRRAKPAGSLEQQFSERRKKPLRRAVTRGSNDRNAIVARKVPSDDGREDLKVDTVAKPRGNAPMTQGVVPSTRQVCATGEAANST